MTIIILKNGTTSINIECTGLTYLEYWEDANIYRCEYSDWAFSLFAMLALIVLLSPIFLIIKCWIKWYHKRELNKFQPNFSRQTSYSSLYPSASRENLEQSGNQNDVVYHQPKKKKAYYPYPAYGTYDELSLPGSTASLHMPGSFDGKDPTIRNPQNIPPRVSSANNMQSYLSNSCPVVTSQLKGFRETLHEEGRAQDERELFHSLGNDKKSQSSLEVIKNFEQQRLVPSLTASSTSSGSRAHSILDQFLTEEDGTEPIKPIKRADSTADKNRILCATPPKNMLTRQDFDDYLADCVMKLPEDQRNGTFLVRNSTTVPNCKVLTLYTKSLENNASLYYFKVYFNDGGYCVLENTSEAFQSIDALIAYYRENRAVLPCVLTECLGRNF